MTTDWQETADEITKSLFLEDDEAVAGDRFPIGRECHGDIRHKEMHRHIKTKKNPGSRIKTEICQNTSDTTALLLTQIINDGFKKRYFAAQHKKVGLSLI